MTLPRPAPRALARLENRWWALVPLGSLVAVVFGVEAASRLADGLTYLALVTTPPLAAAALGRLGRPGRPAAALVVLPLFAIAWAARGSLAGETCAVTLTALACVSLGVLLAAITPATWLKAGLIVMAIADTVLVVNHVLQRPSARLDLAAPALGLPQFQRAELGAALIGYGDLFAAAVLGALLARERETQARAGALTLAFALALGLLFVWVDVLPATVPVALTLIVVERCGLSPHRSKPVTTA